MNFETVRKITIAASDVALYFTLATAITILSTDIIMKRHASKKLRLQSQ
jgi:hypothetical protein